jgi:hypothetical protein
MTDANVGYVPDPLEFWEYASDEEIEAAIEHDRLEYERWLEGKGAD